MYRQPAAALLVCLIAFATGCGLQGNSPISGNTDATALTGFYNALDSIKSLEPDSARSSAARRLYDAAPLAIHDTILPALLGVLKPVLYTNTDADSGLLPFYRARCTEPALSARTRSRAALQLASFWAHIARDADSTKAYLVPLAAQWATLTDTGQALWYATHAQYLLLRGELHPATAAFYQAIARFEGLGDTGRAVATGANLAAVYRSMGDYRHAIPLRRKAARYFTQQADSTRLPVVLEALGADYVEARQYDSARRCLDAVEALLDAGHQDTRIAFYTYITKGGLYVNLHRYNSARRYFEKARPLLPQLQDPQSPFLFSLASIIPYSQVRNVRAEADTIEQAAAGYLAAGDLESAQKCFFSLSNAAVMQPLRLSALDYHLRYDSVSAILADSANRRYAAELAARYEAGKKNMTIALQDRTLKQRSTTVWLLLSLLVGLVLAAVIAILRSRLTGARRSAKRQQEFTQELLRHTEAERSRIAGHLHDGLSHDLLHLKRSLAEGPEATATRIDELINDIRAISRVLHPVMLRQIGLALSLRTLCEKAMADSDLFVSSEINYDGELTPECELQLYRIVQESLTNIVRHARAMAAKVTLAKTDGHLQLTIQDNGRGFDVDAALSGGAAFGLLSILERGKTLGGTVDIQSAGTGTSLHLTIPV